MGRYSVEQIPVGKAVVERISSGNQVHYRFGDYLMEASGDGLGFEGKKYSFTYETEEMYQRYGLPHYWLQEHKDTASVLEIGVGLSEWFPKFASDSGRVQYAIGLEKYRQLAILCAAPLESRMEKRDKIQELADILRQRALIMLGSKVNYVYGEFDRVYVDLPKSWRSSFDIIVSIRSAYLHSQFQGFDPDTTLGHMRSLLKPGGGIITEDRHFGKHGD